MKKNKTVELPIKLIFDDEITFTELKIYSYLVNCHNEGLVISDITNKQIADNLGYTKNTISKCLCSLVDKKYLARKIHNVSERHLKIA